MDFHVCISPCALSDNAVNIARNFKIKDFFNCFIKIFHNMFMPLIFSYFMI